MIPEHMTEFVDAIRQTIEFAQAHDIPVDVIGMSMDMYAECGRPERLHGLLVFCYPELEAGTAVVISQLGPDCNPGLVH
jgi:hypothetical protein